jgi:hypothetical protein
MYNHIQFNEEEAIVRRRREVQNTGSKPPLIAFAMRLTGLRNEGLVNVVLITFALVAFMISIFIFIGGRGVSDPNAPDPTLQDFAGPTSDGAL